MKTHSSVVIVAGLLALTTCAWAADQVIVEDWSGHAVGAKGIPAEWEGQNWGSPAYDFTVVESDGHRALHLTSKNEGSTVIKDIKGKVNLEETPVLEWQWKAVTLPTGGDSRRKATDDQAAQLYVAWPRFPKAVRSRIIGYIWDTTAPVGTIVKSKKTGTVTYIVVRSGATDLGKWLTERRNVYEDFKKVYGEAPESPGALSVGIDSNDTHSSAESFMGPIAFRKPEGRAAQAHDVPRGSAGECGGR
jgi:hypothetical protein